MLRIEAYHQEMRLSEQARVEGLPDREFYHLERAHILSQPNAVLHTRVHFRMLALAIKEGSIRHILGQLMRLVLAAPGSIFGKYPVGNTGGSNVSAFEAMPIPEDLKALL